MVQRPAAPGRLAVAISVLAVAALAAAGLAAQDGGRDDHLVTLGGRCEPVTAAP